MISRREALLDKQVLRLLKDPEYIRIRKEAHQRTMAMAQAAALPVPETTWWTPERERELVAQAEAERDLRRRGWRHPSEIERELRGLRKPPARETRARPIAIDEPRKRRKKA
jgi:hypothetical protein